MKIYDISQELFSSKIFPGDPVPECERIAQIENGDSYNLTYMKCCAHNGTHMDAPRHFVKKGKAIEEIPLEQTMGLCKVVKCSQAPKREELRSILSDCHGKVLFKGDVLIMKETAEELVRSGVELVGVEGQTIGPPDAPGEVHQILLEAGIVILEGLVLSEIDMGNYVLCAQPLKLGGSDGAPVRAVLLDEW